MADVLNVLLSVFDPFSWGQDRVQDTLLAGLALDDRSFLGAYRDNRDGYTV